MRASISNPANREPARMWRWGVGLAALAAVYILAVIAFIIVY
jgi:hypothetical protein